MLNWLLEPLQYGFMWRSLTAAGIVGVVCAVVGTFVVLRGMAFFGDALSHAILPGVAVSYLAGGTQGPLFWGALAAAVLTALGIGRISQNQKLREDTAIGVVFAGALALGIAMMSPGLALRKSWQPLLETQIRWLPVLIGALVVRVVASLAGDVGYPFYVAALVGTSMAAAINFRLVGAPIVAFGGCLNLFVVLLNHGMPVDPIALSAIGAQMPRDPLHVVLEQGTRLGWIADINPVGIVRSVYSAGDVFIAIGGFLVPFSLFTRR